MLLKLLVNPSDPPLESLIVAEAIKSKKKHDITVVWCNTWTGNGNIRLCNEDDVVLAENIFDISRYLGRAVDISLYGDTCIKSKTEIDHWLTFTLGQLNIKIQSHVDYVNSLIYLDRILLTRTWLCCKKFTLADIHVYCTLLKNKYIEKELTYEYSNVTRWYKHVQSFAIVRDAFIQMKKNILPKEQIQFCVEKTIQKTRKQEGKFVDLPGAEMGKVVVRFPPEASGYLHIGHAKAALLNQYYAEAFEGQLIMRFDDTNPAKESTEFEEAILHDLRLLQIKPDRFTHTSDYFDIIQEYCTKLIKENKAYVDDTPAHIMKEQREQKQKSKNRDNSIEENLTLWQEMICGTEKGQECCVRAKIDYESTNGCMRDPTIYRCKLELHPYTQDKYKVYPTYDFACPIVDSIENVTHTLRTTEYHDRDAQFYWILDALELRRPYIWEYSRLNMTHTVLSKRKLTWFVNENLVDGWDDPRFPTVRGILRRGMTVEGLKQFIIAQGSSKSVVFMEWDKIWAINKKVIDPVALRYTALDYDKLVPVNVLDAKEEWLMVQNHPKDPSKGFRNVLASPTIFIENDDATNLCEGQNVTFINWGNLKIIEINRKQDGSVMKVHARLNLENKDYKSTVKITWVAKPSPVFNEDTDATNSIPCYAVYFDHILNVPILGKNDDFKNFVTKDTRREVQMLGEVALQNVKKGDIIQIQRKGFFICDVPYAPLSFYSSRERPLILFHIPDGHMSTSQKANQQKSQKMKNKINQNPKVLDEKILFDKIQQQSEKLRHLKNTLNEEQRILDSLQIEYKMVTGYDWKLKETTVSNTKTTQELQEIFKIIQKQADKVRNLKSSKADKSIIDQEVKILLSLKTDYKNATGQDWKPDQVAIATTAADTKTESKEILKAEQISAEIQKQGDKVRNLKNSKADKSIIDQEVKILLSLKTDYKNATGQDWKPGQVATATTAADTKTENKEILKAEQISAEIQKQGDKVRNLKNSKADKSIIDQEVKILLSLKTDYKSATGQDWKPGQVATATIAVDTKTESKEILKAEQISAEIQKQGDKVRNLKSSKADKSIIDQEVKILLSLKTDYKNVTGQDWKPGQVATATTAADTKTENKKILKAEQISAEIQKQGDKVRNLKSSKADKSIIDQEVKILLSLKTDYKNATGQDWKPGQVATATIAANTKTENKAILKAEQISAEIQKQGDKVRNLKNSKADKSIIDQEVKILLSLKTDYKSATGQDWKPGQVATATIAVDTKTESKEILKAEQISAEIQKQGDKVRNLKSSKADKSIIDQEVKILLSLKTDYKNVTGQDWKPGQVATATTAADTKTESKEILKAEQISAEIQKQGDKVRNLKSSKADKSIIDQEVKILLSLKTDYKNATGQDWKPGQVATATTAADTKTESKEILKAEQISVEIQKQGDKIRNLKSSKAGKSIIEEEVKILLSLKDDYKNTTGQNWKPSQVATATTVDTKLESKEILKAEQISAKIQKQVDVQNTSVSEAERNIIEQKIKMFSNLENYYKSATDKDWQSAQAATNIKMDSKEILKAEHISEEIQKQGDKIRNLKSTKADKSIIHEEVKILLSLKNDYQNVTGQEWKLMKAEVEPKKVEKSEIKAGKSVEKEITKAPTGKDTDTNKTGTRLGLEVKKKENFFDWYSQIITKSGMIEYYDVSGCYILRPWSFAIWKIIKEYIDKVITSLGVHECYFPIFVTRSVLEKEKTHIADFAPEVAWVTKCGESDLAEPIAIRPTSETVMYPAYAKWLKSDTELPLRLNQWNNVVRWEFKDPKPFLRTREFLWQEGHTAFATKAEADEEVLIILDMYAKVYEDLLAVPIIKGRKTEKEKFAGGDYTTTVEAFISASGRAIQGATSHHLGQNFSKMFNIQVEGVAEGDEKTFVYQNSWGLTTRTIGVMIMTHGDDKGLVLPPKVASIQAVVVPCGITASTTAMQREILQFKCNDLVDKLKKVGHFKVYGDFRNNRTPGWKFNHWELKGVPVRIELGPKDLEKDQVTFVRRDTSERSTAKSDEVIVALASLLNDIQTKLLERARQNLNEHLKQIENWDDFGPELNKKNLLLVPFCGEPSCEEHIKADSAREDSDEPGASMGAKSLCIPFEQPKLTKPLNEMKCIHYSCINKPKFYTLFGRSY